jgi:heme exporter protein A
MIPISLTAADIGKDFNRRPIFRGISFSLVGGESLAITGRNGSGKSTLVKIISGLLSPTRGSVGYKLTGKALDSDAARGHIGLVSPYLQLYDEFTALENLTVLSTIRSDRGITKERVEANLREVGLWERRKDFVRTFSSGMKQRLKYAFALIHQPAVLILDEPTSNLDDEGIEMVRRVVEMQRQAGLLIVATNDADEAGWCSQTILLGDKVTKERA